MAEGLKPEICVIGGGPGGIAVAMAAARHGVPVVLVEKGQMGGFNLTRGSIPSKALVAAAGYYETLRRGPAIGVTGAPLQVNLGRVHDHIRSVTEAVAPNVSAERLRALGVTVISGPAHFADRHTAVVGDTSIRAGRFVIATGAVPAAPELPGLPGVDYATVDAAFDLTRKPTHLLIYGADARGLEIAQAYNRLGVDATVIDTGKALAAADPELTAPVIERLRAEGVRIRDGANLVGMARRRGGIRVTVKEAEGEIAIDGSHLLVVAGWAPNVDGLGLDAAAVAHNRAGIIVDRQLRTTNRRIFAIGDVIAGQQLANRAEAEADRVVRMMFSRLPSRGASPAIPAVASTDPGLATVGMNEAEAESRHKDIRVLRFPFAENDLSQAERTTSGMLKVVTSRGGAILGAGAVGRDAGEVIAPWSLAIANRLGIDAMASMVAAYPSRADISRRAAASFGTAGPAPRLPQRMLAMFRKSG